VPAELITISSLLCWFRTLCASPFAGAESLEPAGDKDVAEAKGLVGTRV